MGKRNLKFHENLQIRDLHMFKHIKITCFELILNTQQDFKFLFCQSFFFSKKLNFLIILNILESIVNATQN